MQGEVHINDWRVALEGSGFDPQFETGRVLIGSDSLPSCLIWIHVDDFFLYEPTRTKCTSALKIILDLTARVALICHLTKLKPRAQIQKLCGFLYDSETIPKLRVLDNKILRALALLGFLVRGSSTVLCRLALEAMVGTQQYFAPSTPIAIGASFLHHVYNNIHNETLDNFDNFDNIQDFYQSGLDLGHLAEADFSWWEKYLKSGLSEQVQTLDLFTRGVAWDDGSGSGSGGTFEWLDSGTGALPEMEAWMGAWNGTVYSFTSNWRELRTVSETLKRKEVVFNKLRGKMFFYFTDKVIYNICKKGPRPSLYICDIWR
jgi:hypothetical protein